MRVGPSSPLPLPPQFENADAYVDSLLHFATSSWLLQTLCGGVHILDFFTRTSDVYSQIFPQDWRDWFETRETMQLVDFFMHDDLSRYQQTSMADSRTDNDPPASLIEYLTQVRMHLLTRDFTPLQLPPVEDPSKHKHGIPLHVAVGMKDKKAHEVDNFARYVDQLTKNIAAVKGREITHVVDFGSGQNYLGRTLASPPYSKHIIAVESKPHNIEGSKIKDVRAKLAKREIVMRNKKKFRTELYGLSAKNGYRKGETPKEIPEDIARDGHFKDSAIAVGQLSEPTTLKDIPNGGEAGEGGPVRANLDISSDGKGSVQYVVHRIEDGDLSAVINQIVDPDAARQNAPAEEGFIDTPVSDSVKPTQPNLMTISLHSCGNLLHHGLRTLTLNPNVSAVCLIGCCYNLVTERLGMPTYKLPSLRPNHPRLVSTSSACDPHGFPMSTKYANYPMPPLCVPPHVSSNPSFAPPSTASDSSETRDPGIHLNITARMMSVQAPANWSPHDSSLFFTRHFYRALLQRIFLDLNLIPPPSGTAYTMLFSPATPTHLRASENRPPRSPAGTGSGGDPVIIGTLKKSAYESFVSYVRAAGEKLGTTVTSFDHHGTHNVEISDALKKLSDEEIKGYEARYAHRKKHLAVVWSLMAYSAGVVECMMVVDRWEWLREQPDVVGEAWVAPVFGYGLSPRNLCVVGVRK